MLVVGFGLVSARALVFLHLSDLHFRTGTIGQAQREAHVRDRLEEDLRLLLGEAPLTFDAVLVTGDIAFAGKEDEYDIAGDWFDRIAGLLGLDRTKILVCPGNHDVDWDQIGSDHVRHRENLRDCADGLIDKVIDDLLADPGKAVLDPLRAYSEFAAGREAGLEHSLCWELPMAFGSG
jgi:DNA repair exonuclease SbcCD nuclease subunit